MRADNYVRLILTIIAIELGWLALTQTGTPVTAQQRPEATPVVITGIDLENPNDYLPVGVLGQPADARNRGFAAVPTTVANQDPLRVSVGQPITVRTTDALRIYSDRPILVENVGYTGTPQPR